MRFVPPHNGPLYGGSVAPMTGESPRIVNMRNAKFQIGDRVVVSHRYSYGWLSNGGPRAGDRGVVIGISRPRKRRRRVDDEDVIIVTLDENYGKHLFRDNQLDVELLDTLARVIG